MAPRDNPELAGVIFAEHAEHGYCGATIAKHIIETYFAQGTAGRCRRMPLSAPPLSARRVGARRAGRGGGRDAGDRRRALTACSNAASTSTSTGC